MSALGRAYAEMKERLEPMGVTVNDELRTIMYQGHTTYVRPYTTKAECKKMLYKFIKRQKEIEVETRQSEHLPLFNQENIKG